MAVHRNDVLRVADLIDQAIISSGKSLLAIARECGFPQPNVLSMIRKGHTKVPPARIPALARALGLDARTLFEMTMRESQPELWSVLDALYGIGQSSPSDLMAAA